MGIRILESLNANYVHHQPKNTCTDVFLPQQVALDFERFVGGGEHLRFYVQKEWIHVQEIKDGNSLMLGPTVITPFRLTEELAYGFLLADEHARVVIIPDELRGWQPDSRKVGVDVAVLPIGVFEHHPITGDRLIPKEHPALGEEWTFADTLDVIQQMRAKKTLRTHINGLSFDELMLVEKKLQADGLHVQIAYDTLLVDVK